MDERQFRQILPRPARYWPGDAPAWTTAPGAPSDLGVERVVSLLEQRAAVRPTVPPRAAVLIPLLERGGVLHVVLIRRAAGLGRDPGHIAFPGGHIDPGEEPQAAALREAFEEVGIVPGEVRVLGSLQIAHRIADDQRVIPFVGLLAGPVTFNPNPDEVELVFEVPLGALFADGVAWQEHWDRGTGRRGSVRFFADPQLLGDDVIWGLTAKILWELLEILTDSGITEHIVDQ